MNKRIKLISEITLFSSLVIVLQIIATFINFGSFPITLTLIPIIVAGAVYGPVFGLILGLVFGCVVDVMVITGADPSGAVMMSMHPIITLLTCLIKGGLAGWLSALFFKHHNKLNSKLKVIISSLICPFVNTSVLAISLLLFFDSSIQSLIGMFVSVNFVIECIFNVVAAPYFINIISHYRNEK